MLSGECNSSKIDCDASQALGGVSEDGVECIEAPNNYVSPPVFRAGGCLVTATFAIYHKFTQFKKRP